MKHRESFTTRPSTAPELVICVRSSGWLAAIRWALRSAKRLTPEAESGTARIAYRHVVDWKTAWSHLQNAPASVVMLELDGGLTEEEQTYLSDFPHRFPDARMVVLGRRENAGCLWLARQLGAIHAVAAFRDLTPTMSLVARHLAKPRPPIELEERIWQNLPWTPED